MARDVISQARAGSLLESHGGPAVLFYAPLGTTFPTAISDVIDFDAGANQFKALSPWTSLGITRSGITVTRGFEDIKRDADQSYGAFDLRPTGWSTMVSTELLKTDPVTLQLAWVGGAITTVAKVSTTLQVAVAATDTTMTVNSISGLSNADYIIMGTGPYQELCKISGSPSGNTVTIAVGAQYAHASGTLVAKLEENTMPYGTARNIPPYLLAVIAPVNYDDPAAGGVVNGLRMFAFRRVKLEAGQRQINHSNGQDWTLPVSFYAFPDLDQGDPDTDTFVVYDLAY